MDCKHKNIKKIWPFGRNSHPRMNCRDCGKPIKPHDFKKS